MDKLQFTIKDIQLTLQNNYKNLLWTGKIFDEHIRDYKDLEIKDFANRSMHSFLFINKEKHFCEKDIQISNINFKIYDDSKFSQLEKDLSTEWINLIQNKNLSI